VSETRRSGSQRRNWASKTLLRVLIVEDSTEDTVLLLRQIARGGYELYQERVDTLEAMREALDERWDVVVANRAVPCFSVQEALDILKESGLDLPLVIVSGDTDEEAALAAVRAGASDYLAKGDLSRLSLVIERELCEAERRHRNNTALRQGEELYRAVVDQSSECIFLVDAQSKRILRANDAFRELLGYASEEVRRLTLYDLVDQDRVSVDEDARLVLNKGSHDIGKRRYRSKDGTLVDIEVRANAISLGGTETLCCVAKDVAESYWLEEVQDDEWARQVTLHTEASTALTKSGTLRDILQQCAEALLRRFDAALVCIWTFDSEEGVPELRASAGLYPDLGSLMSPVSLDGSSKHRVQNRRAYVRNDIQRDPRFQEKEWAVREGIIATANCPLIVEDEVVGAVALFAREPLPQHTLVTMTPVMDAIAQVIRRKWAEKALHRSEERLRIGLAAVPIVLFALDREGIFTLFEGKGLEKLGLKPGQVVGQPVFDIYRRVPTVLEYVNRALAGEQLHETTDVGGLMFETWYSPLWEGEETVGVVGIAIDVTERKQAQDALRQSEDLYHTVVEQTAESILLVDVKTERVLEANTALQRSLGYTSEELRQMTLREIVADDGELSDYDVQRYLNEGSIFLGERQYLHKDGSLVDFEISVNTVPYGLGEALCIVALEVTDRKQAEESLRRSLSVLLALREAGQLLGSTLESEEIVSRLLEIMQSLSNLVAMVISVQDENGRSRVWRSVGLEGLEPRARYAPQALEARRAALQNEEPYLFELQSSRSGISSMVGLCLPLRTRDRVIGVLEAYGLKSLVETDTLEIIYSLTSQAASALENARLYGELGERERRLHELVGKILVAQEEERRRVAYDVHDGLAQVAAAAHQHLQAFSRRYPPDTERSRKDLERVSRLVRRTVSDARKIIANMRPTALDDFGLAAAVSLEVERLREEGYKVEYREELGEESLPDAVSIALYRISQEALTNVRKHARTRRVLIMLRRQGNKAVLRIRDFGRGFDPTTASAGSGPAERVGLAGMRERVGMLSGKLEIHSLPGIGTSIKVVLPLSHNAEED
jgi:PAS domain S-box-containing protein